MRDMTHEYVWHDLWICVTWLILFTTWHCTRQFIHLSDFLFATSLTYLQWLIHMCDMTHPYAWHDSSICVTWLIHMRDMTRPYVWHDSSICVTWLIALSRHVTADDELCDMTRWYVWHDSWICVTWLVDMCDMTQLICDVTHGHMWRDLLICVTWLIWCVTWTHPYVLHDPSPSLGMLLLTTSCVTWLIHMCDMTHEYV